MIGTFLLESTKRLTIRGATRRARRLAWIVVDTALAAIGLG